MNLSFFPFPSLLSLNSQIVLGEHDLDAPASSDGAVTVVGSAVLHPGYDADTSENNDFAIVTLDQEVQYSREVKGIN